MNRNGNIRRDQHNRQIHVCGIGLIAAVQNNGPNAISGGKKQITITNSNEYILASS